MTIIFIRHSSPNHNNYPKYKTKYKYDSSISEDGKYLAEYESLKLKEKYGTPLLIISSPFLRCRETANILAKNTDYYGSVEIEPRISEYLHIGHKNPLNHIRPETKFYDICVNETPIEHKNRIQNYYNYLLENIDTLLNGDDNNVIFIVTHGYNIHTISNIENNSKKIEIMDYYVSDLSVK